MGFFKKLGRVALGFGTGGLSEVARAVGGDTVSRAIDNYVEPAYLSAGAGLASAGILSSIVNAGRVSDVDGGSVNADGSVNLSITKGASRSGFFNNWGPSVLS